MSSAIPISIILGLITVFIAAYFQRRQWINGLREEIRVRETKLATKTLFSFSLTIDRRIAAQRRFLRQASPDMESLELNRYRDSIEEFTSSSNMLRAQLKFYFGFQILRSMEEDILKPIVFNGMDAEKHVHGKPTVKKGALNKDLSLISRRSYIFLSDLHDIIAREEIGPLKKINDWKRIDNNFISKGWLLKRIFDTSRYVGQDTEDG